MFFSILVTPFFNLAATAGFIDPLRAANYLTGETIFRWDILSDTGGTIPSSNGMSIETRALTHATDMHPDFVLVSSSWAPDTHHTPDLTRALTRWARSGVRLGAIDTGTFVLAQAGLMSGRRATVHYEHIDALAELFPDITVTEDIFVVDGNRLTCCGGTASVDFALHLVREVKGASLANAAARYLFHHQIRGPAISQNPTRVDPLGQTTPGAVRRAIDLMEAHLEQTLTVPEICEHLGVSQRHLSRLFKQYVGKTPVLYYRDIRLDRARGLVTQTEMKLSQVAVASGFASQVHFSRAYRDRFGLPPMQDRIDGRVPFEFRAWPMHAPSR